MGYGGFHRCFPVRTNFMGLFFPGDEENEFLFG